MLCHLVLFRPRVSLTPAERRSLIDTLESALREIPAIRGARVGTRVTLGCGYERLMREDYPFAVILEFDDAAGLRAYLQHPAHDRLGAQLYEYADAVLIYDYEMGSDPQALSQVP